MKICIIKQKDYVKACINLNTEIRAKCKNNFEKYFFKLMNSSVFGKSTGMFEAWYKEN